MTLTTTSTDSKLAQLTASRKARLISLLILAACALAASLAIAAPTARAADIESSGWRPGWVSAHTHAVASAPTSDIFSQGLEGAAIGFDTLYLYASPASAQTQVVTVTNTIKGCRSNLGPVYVYGCYNQGSSTGSWYVAPGAWRSVTNTNPLNVAFSTVGADLYFAQLTVTWRTLSGAYLGHEVINYRSGNDLRCDTTRCGYLGGGNEWEYVFH
jgi:hypothetical protein